jgi:hypothetical protein
LPGLKPEDLLVKGVASRVVYIGRAEHVSFITNEDNFVSKTSRPTQVYDYRLRGENGSASVASYFSPTGAVHDLATLKTRIGTEKQLLQKARAESRSPKSLWIMVCFAVASAMPLLVLLRRKFG